MSRLEVVDVVVRFGGIVAVDRASFGVEPGAITGLIGPNGAGKTTTFNVMTGLQAATSGSVLLDGQDITRQTPQQRARAGIGRTFQKLEVFGSLTVRDNIRVAAEIRETWTEGPAWRSWFRGRQPAGETPRQTAERLLDLVGLRAFADQPADSVPTGIARLTELARALAGHPRVLLLDEPSSGLNEEETGQFAALLQRLAASGIGIVIVEHDVDLVMSVCSHIHVLDFGVVIASGTPDQIRRDPAVQAAYLGAEVDSAGLDGAGLDSAGLDSAGVDNTEVSA